MAKKGREIIGSEAITKAENLLRRTYKLQTGEPRLIFDRARIDRTAADTLIAAHSTILFKQYLPDIDPRQEPAIRTMFAHFLAVGSIARGIVDGSES